MIAFPFDSHISGYDSSGYPIYDRASTSADFARLFSSLLRDGVFGADMCSVLASSGMSATVSTGGMMIRGRFGYIESAETVKFEAAESRARIDTVVLRRDLSSSVNNIVCAVKKGTAAASPVAPALTRDGTVWELGIADVKIPANSTAISQSNISDTRLESERCGLVAAILTDINTTALYNQIQSDLESFKAVEQANFEEWFENLQTNLDSNTAANLQSQVTVLKQDVSVLKEQASAHSTASATLTTGGWSGSGPYTQTVTVIGVTTNNTVIVTPDAGSFENWAKALCRASAQGVSTLTFTAKTKPSAALTANVMIIEGVD